MPTTDPDARHFRRYLELRLEEYSATHDLCPNSIAAYKKYLGWLDESPGYETFSKKVKDDGQMFSIAKAEELDKRHALWVLQKNFEHEKSTLAAELRLKAVESSTDFVTLSKTISSVAKLGGDLDGIENQIHNAVVTLFVCVTAYFCSNEKEKSGALANVGGAWEAALALDENLSWEKISLHAPYRRRLMLDEARMKRYGDVVKQAGGK